MGAKFIINNIKYFKMNACVGTLVAEAWSTFCDQTGDFSVEVRSGQE